MPTRQPTPRRRRLPPEGDPARYVFVDADSCPECAGIELKTVKTARPAGGDAAVRYSKCLDPGCTTRFVRFDGNVLVPAAKRLPWVPCCRPRCPKCKSDRLRVYATKPAGDGSVTRYARCRGCDWHFQVVTTNPGAVVDFFPAIPTCR